MCTVPCEGLLHLQQQEEILCERDFLEAKKLLRARETPLKEVLSFWTELVKKRREEEAPGPSDSEVEVHSIFLHTVSFLLHSRCLQLAERALALELQSSGLSEIYLLHLGHLHLLRHDCSSALVILEEALCRNPQSAEAWALKGHCLFLQGSISAAQHSYERSLSLQPQPQQLVRLRLGSIYLQNRQFEQGAQVFLEACEQNPSPLSWLGLGVACYRLGELALAESTLTEANVLDPQSASVWAHRSLICLKSGRLKEAVKCFKNSEKFGLRDDALHREFTEMHEQMRNGSQEVHYG
uniref:Uncharacterized protein n=1 Tax=Knipowitschia caucasica TaxID=637954 RepID=A0AAV2KS82_KNICA